MEKDKNEKGHINNVSHTKALNKKALESSSSPVRYFAKDSVFYFCYKKTERIAAALFLVTSFFSEEEPLRVQLRSAAIRLLNTELSLIEEVGTSRVAVHQNVRKHSMHIVSLLHAGYYAGLISEMNYTVLRDEIMTMLASLPEHVEKNKEQSLFSSDFFDVPQEHIKESHVATQPKEEKSPQEPSMPREPRPSKGQKTSTESKKSERRAVIIDIVRRKGTVSIKDISHEFSGYSEKTIQRELGVLVEQGILKREGERRWSRYMLAE